MVPRINIWIERDDQVAMSIWRVALLEAVARTGSMSSAAEQMHVSYRIAWNKIKEMEERLGIPLITTRVGGTDGGGTSLTPAAEKYIQHFRHVSNQAEQLVEQRFADVFLDLR